MKQVMVGWAVLAFIGFGLAGCSSPEPGTLEGTATACNGIYPINNQTPQDAGTLRLKVVVVERGVSGSIVASQQLKGNLANSFRPLYKVVVPPGTYRAVAVPEVREPWLLQTRTVRVRSGATTHWAFGCSDEGS
jgi:hypothetical protein